MKRPGHALVRRFSVWPSPLPTYPRTATYEATIRGVIIALTALQLAVAAAALDSPKRSSVILAGGLAAALALIGRRTTSAIGMLGLLVALALTPLVDLPNGPSLLSIVIGLACGVCVSQLRASPSLLALVVWFAGFAVVYLSSEHGHDIGMLVDHAVINLGAVAATAIIHRMLIRKVMHLDRVRSAAFETELADQLRHDELQAADTARRVLHDQVLFALVRMADSGSYEPDTVRATIASFARPSVARPAKAEVDAANLVRNLLPTDIDFAASTRGGVRPRRVEPRIAIAIERALGEVVRNAVRHGDRPISVQLATTGDDYELTVTNPSSGKDRPRPGWGWRNSVEAELRAIGGAASLTRNGTEVVAILRWPVQSDTTTSPRGGPAALTRQELRTLTLAAWPALAAHTYIAARHTPSEHWWPQAAVVAVLWVAQWLLIRTLTVRRLVPARAITLALVAAASIWVSLTTAGSGSLTSYSSWVLGLASIPLCLAAFFSPARLVALLSTAIFAPQLVILATRPELLPSSANGALLTGIIPWFGYAVAQILHRVQLAADRDEAVAAERLSAISARRSQDRATGLLDFTRRTVVPFLSRVLATGEGSLSSDDRGTARRLAQQVRDELNAPGLLDEFLRARLAAARARGADIVIHPTLDPQPDRAAALLRALDRLLDDARSPDRVNLRLDDATMSLVAPSATTRLGVLAASVGAGARVVHDEFAATLVLTPSPDEGMDVSAPVE